MDCYIYNNKKKEKKKLTKVPNQFYIESTYAVEWKEREKRIPSTTWTEENI